MATTTAEAYDARLEDPSTRFQKAAMLFGRIDWRKDRFSGYDEQLSETLGYGRRLTRNLRSTYVERRAGRSVLVRLDLTDGTSLKTT